MALEFRSLAEMFLHRIVETPQSVAFQFPSEKKWKAITWAEAGERVRAIAGGLRALGIQNEDRCAILSSTRLEWVLADLGILCAAAATTGIYPSSSDEDLIYILKDCNARVCFVENEAKKLKLLERKSELPELRKLVCFSAVAQPNEWLISLDELMQMGRTLDAADPAAFERVAKSVDKSSLACIIYTSGTTGAPKGVELVHDTWLCQAEGVEALNIVGQGDLQYLWLPLAHVFGKVLEATAIRIGFPTAIDGRLDKMLENLAVIQPTFVCAVPRFFEKLYNRVLSNAKEGGRLKQKLFEWALKVGERASRLRLEGRSPRGWVGLQYALADRMVYSKLKQRLGGRLRFFVSGGAPLSERIAQFFYSAGVTILEGYGLTECAVAAVNRPEKILFGTVGLAMPGSELRLSPEDGEVLVRGRNVMRGYHGLTQATREVIDSEGWFHTGDIGVMEDGCLRLTDRKKDLIKTSNGKYVAPQMLETRFKALCPYASQILVFGDRRNYCAALISLDEESILKWARSEGLDGKSYAALAADGKVRALIQSYLDELNSRLASYETIKKFALLPTDLSQERGELTPSLKVKRRLVEQKYKSFLDQLYGLPSAAA